MMRNDNRRVKVLRKHENKMIGIRVELTQEIIENGQIIHVVKVIDTDTDENRRIYVHDAIEQALKRYRKAISYD